MDAPQVENLRRTWHTLKNRIWETLQARHELLQMIEECRRDCHNYLRGSSAGALQQGRLFSPDELHAARQNIARAIHALDEASLQQADPPGLPRARLTKDEPTGGRPHKHIDPRILREAVTLAPMTDLAPVFGVSARTIRRILLRHGLSEPGEPVFVTVVDPDGSHTRLHMRARRQALASASELSDAELDTALEETLRRFSQASCSMILGHLKVASRRVQRDRVAASYERVHSVPAFFSNRHIQRQTYWVPGANSLWHHDRQHSTVLNLLCSASV
ncbi:hypothetical protein K488DRAFT_74870 [Vararia minispora EC-137]|uniref:Uncharacterized protein n=1 Tax=Vararia minispora EC-137 TaxID=1314806 RepID=A0ACB8Q6N3_9AGAM|nr:hypothetical protein K488DRAFT_74870 [Vararia minispora EC-137]